MNIIVKQNQTIQDISMMYTGSSENAVAILLANGRSSTVLYVGEELIIPESLVSNKMKSFYDDIVGCSPVPLDPAQWSPPAPLPNSDVNVRINSRFYKTVNAPNTIDIPLKNTDGELIDYYVDNDNIVIDSSGSWIRPSSWPQRPELLPGVYFLIEHYSATSQWLYWYSDTNTNIYIDSQIIDTVSSNQPFYFEISAEDHGFDFQGRKFSWIYFDCGSNPLINWNHNFFPQNEHGNYRINVLEELINLDHCQMYNREDNGFIYHIRKNTKNVWFKPTMNISSSRGLFMNTFLINIENLPVFHSELTETFRDSNTPIREVDCSQVANLSYCFYGYNNNVTTLVDCVNTGLVTTISSALQFNYGIVHFTMDDASSVNISSMSMYGAKSLQYLRLEGMRVSIDLSYCYSMNRSSLLMLIDSLADMTGMESPSLLLINVPDNQHNDVISAANTKNWTIVI